VTTPVPVPDPPAPGSVLSDTIFPGQPACASDAGSWCATLYQWTSSDFLARSADALVSTTLSVALILALAFGSRFLIHRAIHRLVEGAANSRVSRLIGRTPRQRADGNGSVTPRRAQRARTIGSVLRSISSAVILSIAAIMVLAEFGVALAPILASAGIVGVAVGFGAQNLVRDFLSGMFMLLEDQYGVGDIIDAGEASGVVESVGLRITTLRDLQGTVWYIRNGEILRVGNKSQGYAVAVVDIPIGHTADIAAAIAVAERATAERIAEKDLTDDVLEPPEMLGVELVAPEGITLRLTVKVKPGRQWAIQRALNAAVSDAFDDAAVPRPTFLGGLTNRPSVP
jgi:moderate conductance mechanosensitive channel